MTPRGIAVLTTVLAAAPAAHALCTANASPPVACTITVPKHPKIRIARDGYGVPHLKARSLYDVGYGMGRAQAEDRLFQMELVRKSATGNVAELFGTDFLSDDIDARRQFYSEEERDALSTRVSCSTQTVVQGFVDGVNAYIAEIYGEPGLARVPHEFFFVPTAIRLSGNNTIPTGVRYTIETIGGVEVYEPDAWRTSDVAAIGVLLAGRFGSGGGRQLRQAALLNYLTAKLGSATTARQIFEDVRWIRDPNSPTTVPKVGAINKVKGGTTPVPIADAAPPRPTPRLADAFGLLVPPAFADAPRDPYGAQHDFLRSLAPSTITRGLRAAERMEREAKEANRKFGVFIKSGSNAWVVAPERSASKHALLWGGPQEGFDNPNIDVELYVNSHAMRAGGMMIAGVPGILIGQTTRFAFTTTSGEIDNSTLYVETLEAPAAPEPQAADAQYRFLLNGSYLPMDRRTETFHWAGEDSTKPAAYAPGGPAPNDGPLLYNVFRVNDCDPDHFHGFVMEFDLAATPPRAFSYKTAYWKNESSTVDGFLGLGLDHGFDDFQESVHKVVSLHNFFFADQKGNIAYWSAGARPAFPVGFDDRLPADGSGSQEWGTFGADRYLPFSKSLLSVNPTQGWLTNWNTKPADEPYVFEGNSHDEHWGEVYRSQRMELLLDANAKMSFDDVKTIEHDVGTMDGSTDTIRAAAPALVPFVLTAYANLQAANDPLVDPTTHPTLAQVVQILGDWNAHLADPSQIFANGHFDPAYEPSRGQPGMSIFFQWWYALKQNLWGGGSGGSPDSAFVGTVDFTDHSIDGNDYLGETTYNMLLHVLRGAASGVPQSYAGDYFGGHRDQIVVESLNDAIRLLAGTGALPEMGFGTCSGSDAVHGFGTTDPTAWGWQPPVDLDFDCLDDFASNLLAIGTKATTFGKAPSENRSTYMQALELGKPIRGENVIAPGQSGFIKHLGPFMGEADPHMGDQAALFRSFTYKPMLLGEK